MNLKLGRSKPSRSKLHLRNYLGPKISPPPPSKDWTLAMTAPWLMMLNGPDPANPPFAKEGLGCCVYSAMAHAVQVITSNGDGLINPTVDDVATGYETSGYKPGDPNTDQGDTELHGMQYMVDHGMGGVRCDAFADVNYTDIYQLKQAISLFGGVYIGVAITQQDMDNFQNNVAWHDLSMDNVLGGHALFVPAYDDTGITVITWGKAQNATWTWYQTKADEAHAMIFFPWVKNSVDTSPDGFNQTQLEADLKVL